MHVGEAGEHLHEEALGMGFRECALLTVDEIEELAVAKQLRGKVVTLHLLSILLPSYIQLSAQDLHDMWVIELLKGVAFDHHVLMKLAIAWIAAVLHEHFQCDFLSIWSCSEIYRASGAST